MPPIFNVNSHQLFLSYRSHLRLTQYYFAVPEHNRQEFFFDAKSPVATSYN